VQQSRCDALRRASGLHAAIRVPYAFQARFGLIAVPDLTFSRSDEAGMAETTKLSVEKALNKLREADTPKSRTTQINEEIEALDEDAKRLREQRLRLERHQRRSAERD
jgi:hypothetical protein